MDQAGGESDHDTRASAPGVSSRVATRLGVDRSAVRLAFALLSLAGGLGAIAYGVLWVTHRPRPEAGGPEPEDRVRRTAGFVLTVFGSLLLLRSLGLWFGDEVAITVLLGTAGSTLIWTKTGSHHADRPLDRLLLVLRRAAGVALVIGAMAVFLAANDAFAVDAVRNLLFGLVVTVVAAALILGPVAYRLVRQLAQERRDRIRSEERAVMAAHLHDSVLQSLALIQRAGSAQEMASLARGQERELRAWLYGRQGMGPGSLVAAVEEAAARVEARHHVRVEVVAVGDCLLDDELAGVVQAAGEAMTNAARHSGAELVSVYLEVESGEVSVFVRDEGRGFDPARVPDDRRGIAESIRGRMQRAGGSATIATTRGRGTEVHLRAPAPWAGGRPRPDPPNGEAST